jgi:hypothetical protein
LLSPSWLKQGIVSAAIVARSGQATPSGAVLVSAAAMQNRK